MDLKTYEAVKFELADILRKAADAQVRTPGDYMDRKARDLFTRLAEDRFNIVMVGRFSRGKTSLMNAMLGKDWLPTGIVPITSVITNVRYGSVENVVLEFREAHLPIEIGLDQLWQYITERGNPGNARRIGQAEIQLPAEILRRGFHFVDTPGLGSSILQNTLTTREFLPEADAIVLVTSFDSPLSEEEFDLLDQLLRTGIQIFLVINKQDLASDEQRLEAISHLEARLAMLRPRGAVPIFAVSATEGLAAKTRNDPDLMMESGLAALEQALVQFVVAKKQSEFLRLTGERLARFLQEIHAAPDLFARLHGLALELSEVEPRWLQPIPGQSLPGVVSQPTGCPACAAAEKATFAFIARFQRQLAYDQATQEVLARDGGLCALHSWQFRADSSQLGICMGFPKVLDRYAQDMRKMATDTKRPICQAVTTLPEGPERCVICEIVEESVADTIVNLKDRPLGSAAWCLPHLRRYAILQSNETALRARLLHEAAQLERVAEDMRRFALKRDGMRRDLTSDEERAAADLALRLLVGDPNVVTSWREK